MSEAHFLICDNCRKRKDLNATTFGGVDSWQTLWEQSGRNGRKRIDLCSINCVSQYLYIKQELKP